MEQPFDKDPNRKPILGPNNIGVGIFEIGEDEGEEDNTIRPLRESLRRLLHPDTLEEKKPES